MGADSIPNRILLDSAALVPDAWLRFGSTSNLRVYNPAVVRYNGRLLMAYRVDFGHEKPFRVATAICVLDDHLRVVPGSVVALSDTIAGETANHFDARFLVYQDRLFLHYNNDWETVPNEISLVELDPHTLEARSAARRLELDGPRQPCEKNWLLFEHDEALFAIYQVDPHIVLRVEMSGAGPVRCWPVYRSEWDTLAYARRYGALRGGTPPVRVGANYVSLFHSRTHSRGQAAAKTVPAMETLKRIAWLRPAKRWLRERFAPVRYYGGIYAFAAVPPFAPTLIRPTPILWPEYEPRRQRPTPSHMSPRRVVYPCGLVRLADDRWLVSYGVHDERAVLRVFTRQEIEGWTVKPQGSQHE